MVNWSNRGQVNKEVLRGPQDERLKDFAIVLSIQPIPVRPDGLEGLPSTRSS